MRLLPKLRGFFKDPQLEMARKILGNDRVVSIKDVCRVIRQRKVPPCPFSYSEAILKECAEGNSDGENWWLVAKLGLSLKALRKLVPSEFCQASVWDASPAWLDRSCDAGYRLINLKLASMAGKLDGDPTIARAHVGTVAEALVWIMLLSGKKQTRLLSDVYHYGHDMNGVMPVIGGYDEKGILLYTLPSSCGCARPDALESLGVGTVLCRVPGDHRVPTTP